MINIIISNRMYNFRNMGLFNSDDESLFGPEKDNVEQREHRETDMVVKLLEPSQPNDAFQTLQYRPQQQTKQEELEELWAEIQQPSQPQKVQQPIVKCQKVSQPSEPASLKRKKRGRPPKLPHKTHPISKQKRYSSLQMRNYINELYMNIEKSKQKGINFDDSIKMLSDIFDIDNSLQSVNEQLNDQRSRRGKKKKCPKTKLENNVRRRLYDVINTFIGAGMVKMSETSEAEPGSRKSKKNNMIYLSHICHCKESEENIPKPNLSPEQLRVLEQKLNENQILTDEELQWVEHTARATGAHSYYLENPQDHRCS